MLGAAFFHMMPEAVRVGSAATIHWAAFGLLALFFLERFFSFHHHEPHAHPSGDRIAGTSDGHATTTNPVTIVANPRPSPYRARPQPRRCGLCPGVRPPSGWSSIRWSEAWRWQALSPRISRLRAGLGSAGLGVFIATLVHKPADALTITSLMLRAGSSRWSAPVVNFGFGLMIPAGVAFFALGMGGMGSGSASAWTAGALAFSAGTFLCIALSDLLPELQFHSHDRLKLSVALLAGFALMAATAAIEPADPPAAAPARDARMPRSAHSTTLPVENFAARILGVNP